MAFSIEYLPFEIMPEAQQTKKPYIIKDTVLPIHGQDLGPFQNTWPREYEVISRIPNSFTLRWRLAAVILVASFPPIAFAEQSPGAKNTPAVKPKRIEKLIDHLRTGKYTGRQDAIDELVAIGQPALPALLHVILYQPGQGNFDAGSVLRRMVGELIVMTRCWPLAQCHDTATV